MANASNKVDWLYPELLSKEGLIEILKQRYVKLPEDRDSVSREALLDLYYDCVIPRPQRKYRQNRRGRDMTRRQVMHNKKRRITAPSNSEPPAKKAPADSSRLFTSFEGRPSGDRLKPPPSCINMDRKVIKLGGSRSSADSPSSTSPSSSAPSSSVSSSLQTNNSSAGSPSPRVIKINRSSSSGDSNNTKSPTAVPSLPTTGLNKTIKLINSHLSASGNGAVNKTHNSTVEQPMETDSPLPTTEKKKFTKISWP